MDTSRRNLVLAAAGALLAVERTRPSFASPAPASPEWQVASPDAVGVSSAGIEDVLADAPRVAALRSLLLVRRGWLIGERYLGGVSESDLLALNSATKSVCSMLVGTTLEQGKLSSLSQTMGQLLPELAQRFPEAPARNVTLAQVLTGSTGLSYDFRTDLRVLLAAPRAGAYAFGLASDGTPANAWSYNDAAVSLLTLILERARGMPLEEIARRDLFDPLGIERWSWGRDRSGTTMAYMGLRLRTRDAIKLAWLMANRGSWHGSQVLSSRWVDESTRTHVPRAWPNPPVQGTGYGYLWFTGTLAGKAVAWAWGYGGQFLFLVPSLELAVATTALDPPPQDLVMQTAAVMGLVSRVVDVVSKS